MSTTHFKTANKQLTLGGDLVVNRLGYGAMHLTGYGMWGPPADQAHAIHVLQHAVYDLGINFIDTADSYGPGDNEDIIRRALHPYPKDLSFRPRAACCVLARTIGFMVPQGHRTSSR